MANRGKGARASMRWKVTVDGEVHELDLASPRASVVEVGPGVYSVLWDGCVYEARVESATVVVAGVVHAVWVADPRELASSPADIGSHGRADVSSPMPGKVVRVLVLEGDEVLAGQGVVVVEAMKMQNELQSPRAGRVTSVRVREGAAVAAGEIMVVVG